jgi:hypothetical protein
LAKTCLTNKLDKEASEVMMSVMNDVNSGVSMQQAIGVFVKAGRQDLAEGMGVQLKRQSQDLLALADEKTNMGDLKGAVQTLLEALHKSPSNITVMVALANGIMRQLGDLGWDHQLAEICLHQIDTIRKLDPNHGALTELGVTYAAAKRKYGISS